MDRRTFVLLTGATSGALIRPPARPIRPIGGSGGSTVGRLKFELDEHRHWSVWYYGDGPPVPLIKAAVIGAWVADQVVTLADLEDSTVGNRRPPGGESVVVRGRAAGVFLEAEFLSSSETGAPQAAVPGGGRGSRERVAPYTTAPPGRRCDPDAHLLSTPR